MALINDITDLESRLAVAHGRHAVTGTRTKHRVEFVGTEKQVTVQMALGLTGTSRWDACEGLFYDGEDIAPENYRFHPGGDIDTLDDLFPDDTLHPGVAYINVRLPVGMADDNQPEKLVGVYRCLRVANYNSSGQQIDASGTVVSGLTSNAYFYSADPALVAADYIIRLGKRNTARILWPDWTAWRDFNATPISETLPDNTTRTIPRFEAHLFFVPPFAVSTALDKIAEVSCADWQKANGKLRFMSPAARSPVFTFNLAEIGEKSFKTYPKDRRERYNQVKVLFRDLDSPNLAQADPPAVINRTALQDLEGGLKRPLEIQGGSMRRSQAQRVASFYARTRIDLDQYAEIKGSPKSYRVLPADAIRVTHDVPDWVDINFKIIDKEKGAGSADASSSLSLQLYSPNSYSDTDHSPLTRPLPGAHFSEFAAPPAAASVTLSEDGNLQADGTFLSILRGGVTFGNFIGDQRGRVWLARPEDYSPASQPTDAQYKATNLEITPHPVTSEAAFEIRGVGLGKHFIKVTTESLLGVGGGLTAAFSYYYIIQGKITPPGSPLNLRATYDPVTNEIVWDWDAPPDLDVKNYRITDGNGAVLVGAWPLQQWRQKATAPSHTIRVYALNTSGHLSDEYAEATFSVPAPATPQNFALTFDGHALHESLTAVPGVTYDFAYNNDGTGVFKANSADGTWTETAFDVASRSLVRYARARRFGIVSDWVQATLTVDPPLAPTLARDDEFSFPSSVLFKVIPDVNTVTQNVVRTVLEISSDNFLTQLPQQEEAALAPRGFLVNGQVSTRPKIYARAYYADIFGAGSTSNTETYVFTTFPGGDIGTGAIGDVHLDVSSNLARTIAQKDTIPIHGGGDLTWNGTEFTWSQRLIALPVPDALGSEGHFNFGE